MGSNNSTQNEDQNEECPEPPSCNCDEAADDATTQINSALSDAAMRAMRESTTGAANSLIPRNYRQTWRSSLGDESSELANFRGKWENVQPNTVIEGLQNNETIKYLEDAIKTRHNYFKEKYDLTTFNIECNANAGNTISNLLTEDKENLDKLFNYYNAYLDDYKNLNIYKDSTISIITNKLNELESVTNKINNYNNSMIIDNRKSNYQKNNYDFYENIHFYTLILYYALFVLYLIFSKFIKDKQYYNKKIIFIMLIYLLLPFVLKYILNFINSIYNYILESNNLKKDTLTYEDMINNKTK